MKKLIIISIAALAMICSSCKKSNKDAAATTTADTTVATQAASQAAAVTESAAFTAAQTKLTDIQKQIEAAATMDELSKAAEAVNAFKAEMATIVKDLSEDEKTTLSELYKNVIETAQKKEAELKKK